MKPLYLSEHVRLGLGSCLRPGGERLSTRMLALLLPAGEDFVLDAGCGTGTTLRQLQERGVLRVVGIDLDAGLSREAGEAGFPVAQGDLGMLPFADHIFDTIICECAWNLTRKERVLGEFHRVLRSGGKLAISDIYMRAKSTSGTTARVPQRSCFYQATDLDTVMAEVRAAGFEILMVEDQSALLQQTTAEFVFAHGSLQAFWQVVLGDAHIAGETCQAFAALRPGLFVLTARKRS